MLKLIKHSKKSCSPDKKLRKIIIFIGMTWSSVAADELFEQCQDKQLVAKVIMHILHCVPMSYHHCKGDKDQYQR